MWRSLFLSGLVLWLVVACAPAAASGQASFLPTPFEPTLAPSPADLATATPALPPPPTDTEEPAQPNTPTPATPPPDTPTFTPTVEPRTVMVQLGNAALNPSQITFKAGEFIRLLIANRADAQYECLSPNFQGDNMQVDESLAGVVGSDAVGKADDDASNGKIRLYAEPQGSASLTFTPNTPGSFQLTCAVSSQQLAATILVH